MYIEEAVYFKIIKIKVARKDKDRQQEACSGYASPLDICNNSIS